MKGRRKPYANGTQNEEDFANNVAKGNSNVSNTSAGSSGAVNRDGKNPFKGIKPGMSQQEIDEQLKKNKPEGRTNPI